MYITSRYLLCFVIINIAKLKVLLIKSIASTLFLQSVGSLTKFFNL